MEKTKRKDEKQTGKIIIKMHPVHEGWNPVKAYYLFLSNVNSTILVRSN